MEDRQKLGVSRAKHWNDWALKSHQRAVAGWDNGFFDDLVISAGAGARREPASRYVCRTPRRRLKPAFDRESGQGQPDGRQQFPITDGAAGCWVANDAGLRRLPAGTPFARLVDYEVSAVDLHTEGLLMAPSCGIPRLLARHRLGFSDIALWEIHEAFAAQVLANVAAIADPDWVRERPASRPPWGVRLESSQPQWRFGSHRTSLRATGARDLSQAVQELWALPVGSRGIVSICADGGQGTVAFLNAFDGRILMKAVRFHEFGAPGVLRYEDAPKPAVQAGQVLVRVHAAGLNPPDWYLREGVQALPPSGDRRSSCRPYPARTCPGIVEGRPDVTAFSPGDEVLE